MILILSYKDDIHTKKVMTHLNSSEVLFLDTSGYGKTDQSLSTIVLDNGVELIIENGSQIYSGKQIHAVWNRRMHKSGEDFPSYEKLEEYCKRERRQMFYCLEHYLNHCRWMSKQTLINKGSNKPYQLQVAQKLGFSLPDTYMGNSPDIAREFIKRHTYTAVKPIRKAHAYVEADIVKDYETTLDFQFENSRIKLLPLYTKCLKQEQLNEIIDSIQMTPCILQQYIHKKYELRITVVDDQVFACKIDAQSSKTGWEDFRHYDYENTFHEPYELPIELKNKCFLLTKELGLNFGCIDIVVSEENGDYYFLEINPNGQWLWIEELIGLPIAKAIARYLEGN